MTKRCSAISLFSFPDFRYPKMLMMAVTWPVMLSRVNVDLLAAYSSPLEGQQSLVDVGWAWFALSIVWCFMCGLGKVMWASNRDGARCSVHGSLVFVPA